MLSESTKRAIASARRQLDCDPSLAAYILRDVPEFKEIGLDELARLLACDPYVCRNDVRPMIERLEAMDKEAPDAH
jgi:hypothetical protein